MDIAQRITSIAEPQTIKMAKLGRELKAQGIEIVDLSLGEPDFATPNHIQQAAIDAIQQGYNKYSPVAGFPDLLQAICTKLERDNGLHYTHKNILVSTGAKQSLANVIMALINPGDDVIIPTPYWVTYATQVEMAGGIPVFVECGIEQNFKLLPQQLANAITPRTRMFIFSSPCNPTGSVYTYQELEALAAVFAQHKAITIISDEIYEYINFVGAHTSIAQFENVHAQVVVVNGLSKGFAMTGWRLGYIAGSEDLIKACDKLQAQYTSGTCSVTQRAGITALLGDLAPTQAMVAAYKERCLYVTQELQSIPGVKANHPDGAFYAFPDISSFFGKKFENTTITNDEDLAMYLLHHAHVSTVCGSAFGNNRCIRLSVATSMPQLVEALKRIKTALAQLA